MKKTLLTLTALLATQIGFAESLVCSGRTNNPNTTDLDFKIEITQKRDRLSRQYFYRSTIQYQIPDGSTRLQSIDLHSKVKTKVNKIIYAGSITGNSLELSISEHGQLVGAVLNHSLLGLNQLPVDCEISGNLPQRPTCPVEKDKSTYLAQAIISSNLDEVDLAVSCGADVNQSFSQSCSPLMLAIEPTCGQSNSVHYRSNMSPVVPLVDFLVNNGAYVAGEDSKGETALIKAAKYGVRDVYEAFIAAEADFNAQDKLGNTALMYAVINGDSWIVEQILEGNPDRTLKNKAGKTAFDLAQQLQNEEIMELVQPAEKSVVIEGGHDGTCSPLEINLKQGQVVEFVLKASHKMFKLDAKTLGLDLMAEANGTHKKIITLEKSGVHNFTCGYHGANTYSEGTISIK